MRVTGWAALAVAGLLAGTSTGRAAPDAVDETAQRFGAREAIRQISLSPDGSKVAMVVPIRGRGLALLVGDLEKGGPPTAVLRSSGFPDQLRGCRWSTDTRLTCSLYIIDNSADGRLGFTRSVALNSDGSGLKLLSSAPNGRSIGVMQEGGWIIDATADGHPGSVLMTRQFLPEETTGTHMASTREGLGVDAVDTVTLQRRTVEQPRRGAEDYIADGHGVVRIMGLRQSDGNGQLKGGMTYMFRRKGSREWQLLSRLTNDASGTSLGFDPYAVDSDADVAYGFETRNGRRALCRMALDGSGKEEVVLARPDVDVDGLIRIGRQRRVVGTSWAVERRETQFFDPELTRLNLSLGKALPGDHNMVFVDASADERKLAMFIGSDTDPGRYYVFDKGTRHLEEIGPTRPPLLQTRLATVKPVSFKAADGTTIPGYLTLPAGSTGKGLPAIVMPHGGPGDRDEWGFDWLSQFFAAKGYAVLQPEFRGSSGYGQAWFAKNGFQSWRTAIGDVNDAGRWLLSSGIAAPGKLGIVGWSYGGYAALQSSVLDPDLYKAIVAVAPVTDLDTLRAESNGFTNHDLVDAFIGHGPHVSAGSPAQNVARIKAPVLLFHGDQDQNVGVGESRLMASRLRGAGKKVDYVEFKGLDHQLEDDDVRAQMLTRSDAFLRAAMGL